MSIADIVTTENARAAQAGKLIETGTGWNPAKEVEFRKLSIKQILDSPYYVGKYGFDLYPMHKQDIIDLWEARRTNSAHLYADVEGIGSGKTFKAGMIVYLLALEVLTTCDFFEKFGLSSASKVAILCMSRDARKAKEVTFQQLMPFFDTPFINEYFKPQIDLSVVGGGRRPSALRFPRNFCIFPGTGEEASSLGWDIYGALMDEANYMSVVTESKRAVTGSVYDAAIAAHDAIEARMISRFMKDGKVAGLVTAISNTRYVGDFLEIKSEQAKTDPTIFATRRCTWEAHPKEKHASTTFKFDVANLEIVPQGEVRLGRIISIPSDFEKFFAKTPARSWRLFGDSPTTAILPYFVQTTKVDQAIDWHRENPFDENKGQFKDNFEAPDYRPRYIHIDLGRSNNSACLAMSYADCAIEIPLQEEGLVSGDLGLRIIVEVLIRLDPKAIGHTIDFKTMREFVYELRSRGFNIALVTYDRFQSMDSIDRLRERGFLVENLSVDRTTHAIEMTSESKTWVKKKSTEGKYTAAYDSVLSQVNIGGLSLPRHYYDEELKCTQFQIEARSLDQVAERGVNKIRPSIGATDDLIQAVAGSVFNCVTNTQPDSLVGESILLKGKQTKAIDRYGQIDKVFDSESSTQEFDIGGSMTRAGKYLEEDDSFGMR